jgi:asparagine synthase (glutamine-hydrolysing)
MQRHELASPAMCGICGAVQVGGPVRHVLEPGVLDRMTDAMTHRGPSDRGTFVEDGVALGARRLSIIDLAAGHQPFCNEDGRVWAAQNGELYNHDELRRILTNEGHTLQTRCDTEIIPHLYERDGVAFEQSLTGKFAIAVWDGNRRRAVLARDRLGIKPLYYAQLGDLVVFASELKSLLASGLVPTQLDHEAIGAYLALGFVPGPRTPLAAVRKLQPGHRLVVDQQGVREERYWEFPTPQPDHRMSLAEAGERLLVELEAAVRRRLMSDVPLGAMLSGGLDSSLIVALMARNMSEPVKTFSVGFTEDPNNELADAQLVAETFGTEHHALELSFADIQITLEELVWWMDEPLVDLSSLGFLALSRLAAQSVTVALSGQGADEMLGGYSRHRRASLVAHARRLPVPLRRLGGSALSCAGGRYSRLADAIATSDPALRQLALRSAFVDPATYQRLARGPLARIEGSPAVRAVQRHASGLKDDPLSAALYLDSQLGLVDDMIHYFDRASMAQSLEVRVPFLDPSVVELCAVIPNRLKVHGLTTKYLLRQIARDLVPQHVIDKRKVGFFNGVARSWMQAQLRGPGADYLLGADLRCSEFLDGSEVARMVKAHANRRPADVDALFSVLMLEVWLTSVLPRATAQTEFRREQITVSR